MFIGVTQGYFKADLSLEDVRDHWDEIRDETDYFVPANAGEEIAGLLKHFS
jgi:hypothetical protein